MIEEFDHKKPLLNLFNPFQGAAYLKIILIKFFKGSAAHYV